MKKGRLFIMNENLQICQLYDYDCALCPYNLDCQNGITQRANNNN